MALYCKVIEVLLHGEIGSVLPQEEIGNMTETLFHRDCYQKHIRSFAVLIDTLDQRQ